MTRSRPRSEWTTTKRATLTSARTYVRAQRTFRTETLWSRPITHVCGCYNHVLFYSCNLCSTSPSLLVWIESRTGRTGVSYFGSRGQSRLSVDRDRLFTTPVGCAPVGDTRRLVLASPRDYRSFGLQTDRTVPYTGDFCDLVDY